MRNTSLLTTALICFIHALPPASNVLAEESGKLLFDFGSPKSTEGWMVVNDNVMGGKSKGGFSFSDGQLIFSGRTNTDGGGFSSIRAPLPKTADMAAADGLRIRLRKTDDRAFKIDLRQRAAYRGRSLSYRAELKVKASESWQDIKIPFQAFSASWRGREITEARLDPADATQLGLFIYDKKDGPFQLEVARIETYREMDYIE